MPTADVDAEAMIGDDTTIWHLAQVRESAVVGRGCNMGRGAYVGPGSRSVTTARSRTTPSSTSRRYWAPAFSSDQVLFSPTIETHVQSTRRPPQGPR